MDQDRVQRDLYPVLPGVPCEWIESRSRGTCEALARSLRRWAGRATIVLKTRRAALRAHPNVCWHPDGVSSRRLVLREGCVEQA
jgi:hypothetical protein